MDNDAANSLLERAYQADKSSTAYLLIDSACRLNPSLDNGSLKREWLNQWMEKQYQTMKGQIS